jgi:hypothetical protein
MNRRDAALIAHLDAIEGRITTLLLDIRGDIRQIQHDIVGMKIDHVTHGHGQDDAS